MRIYQLLLVVFLTTAFSSCVSYRKYEDLLLSKSTMDESNNELREKAQQAKTENMKLVSDKRQLEEEKAVLAADMDRLRTQYNTLDETNRDLLMRYDRMLAQNQQVLATSSSEKTTLNTRLSEQEIQLNKRERELEGLETDIKSKEAEIKSKEAEIKNKEAEIAKKEAAVNELKSSLSEREKRVKELEDATAEKEAKLTALREKVNKALLGFSSADLTVREEKGKVYVSLSQNLLFKSGSKYVNSAGKDAIRKLGGVLSVNPDIDIMVEGHTDTDGDAKSNWNLSVGRATAVVQILIDGGVMPQRITAAGRGEHFPVASNASKDGKAQNRRTEIVLSPQLDALFDIINQ